MWCWHKWSMWELFIQRMYYPLLKQHGEYYAQRRTCSKCGKVQEERI